MLSKVASSTIFWVFGMTRPWIEPWSPRPLANTTQIVSIKFFLCKLSTFFVQYCTYTVHSLSKIFSVHFSGFYSVKSISLLYLPAGQYISSIGPDGKAPVLEIREVCCTPLMLLLLVTLWPRMVLYVRVPIMNQIDVFKDYSYLIGPCTPSSSKKNPLKKQCFINRNLIWNISMFI